MLQVTFKPDAAVFAAGISFDPDTITSRLRELAFLNAGATLQIRFLKDGKPLLPPATAGNSSKAAAAGSSKQRRSRQSSSVDAAAAVGDSSSSSRNGSGSSNGNGSGSEAEGWQVFKTESGLKEYVLW